MHKYIYILLLLVFGHVGQGQDINDVIRGSLMAQAELDSSYADPEHSPLLPEDLAHFSGLSFFPVDTNWVIEAQWVLTPDTEPFEMATTTSRKPVYRKYGELHFAVGDSTCVLSAYQSQNTTPGYEDYLFLPFGDATNGAESYGGGRYIDFHIPESDTVTIDFNRSYNPYCAYNGRYSCPRIPLENILNIPIRAGVKAPEIKH